MSNLLIVESKNDKFFLQALIDRLNLNDIQLGQPICLDDEHYKCLGGLDSTKMITALKEAKTDIESRDIDKVGVIIDQDLLSKEQRISELNDCLKKVYSEAEDIADTSQLYRLMTIEGRTIEFACYFINVDGQGELETLLKEIKSQDSTYADCLEAWQECLQQRGKSVLNRKNFDKFWISNYIRFDTCSKKEEGNAGQKCSMSVTGFEYVMKYKPHIWNFEHEVLNELKDFLRLFG
ncbi:DUF3226 domain-containing protein [Pannus brasiliensis CCIBt3594]|uniref:DUF3226 domain-containing protein n=1 Tax=Pannus brasiliensis CCIBt3594 TaxID=1427578 RepID=A0AAW9QPM1_9CHRO